MSAAPPQTRARIDSLLRVVLEKKASDIHLACGSPPLLRIDGELRRMKWRSIREEDFENLLRPIAPGWVWEEFSSTGDGDFAYAMGDKARFRVNLFRQEHGPAAVLRMIPPRVLTIEDLGLPEQVASVGRTQRGLVLITGPTGSGKSTTLAALIDRINRTLPYHIVTIEDPVEFVHVPAKSIITHREVGENTPNFTTALKAALREDPDAILVGELRDVETMRMALHAAETGLLVFGTLHTNSAAKAIDRLIDGFPSDEQEQVRIVLSEVLKAVVAQILMRKKGGGRVPAFEVVRGSAALANAIREGKTGTIASIIQTGRSQGMMSLDQSLADLVVADLVDADEASEHAVDRDYFRSLVDKKRNPEAPA